MARPFDPPSPAEVIITKLDMISEAIKRLEQASVQGLHVGDAEEATVDQVYELIGKIQFDLVAQVPAEVRHHLRRAMLSKAAVYGSFPYMLNRISNASENLTRVSAQDEIPAGIALGVVRDLNLVVCTIAVLDKDPVPVVVDGPPPKMARTEEGSENVIVTFEVQ